MQRTILALMVLLALSACGGNASGPGEALPALGFPFPSDASLKQLSFTEEGLRFEGAPNALAQAVYPTLFRRVTANGTAGDFAPIWDTSARTPSTLACSLYALSEVHDYDRDKTIRLNWAQSNGADKAFVGMANWGSGVWDWYQCDNSAMATIDETRWGDYTSKLLFGQHLTLILVVVLDDATWTLAEGRLGAVVAPDVTDVAPILGDEGQQGLVLEAVAAGSPPDSVEWTFGSGISPATSTDLQPAIDLGAPGSVPCSVTFTNAAGSDTYNFNFTISPAPAAPDITAADPASGTEGDMLMLAATNAGGAVVTWAWDFDGGATPDTSTEASPEITLGTPGLYSASVTASNSAGSDTFNFQLEVLAAPSPPDIQSVSPLSGASGAAVMFDSVVLGTVDAYAWNFDGGATPGTSTDQMPNVVLGAPGTYNCTLTVTNGAGNDVLPFSLVVNPAAAAPDITGVAPDFGSTGGMVQLVATNAGGAVDDWDWQFGAWATPTSSTDVSPFITLGAASGPGGYPCSVTASNASGSDTFFFNFRVDPF